MKLVYVVCANLKEARLIGGFLVSEGLAKCVNILPHMESHYIWKGRRQKAREVVMLIKTTARHEARVYREIKKRHSYEVPALFTLTPSKVDRSFLNWLSGK